VTSQGHPYAIFQRALARRDLDTAWAGPPDNPEALGRMQAQGLLQTGPGTVRLTRRGRLLQNAVMQQLMDFA
jgi:coproporphyrinogen III oxidase-like Fe-S oxidoreductase